MSDYSFTYQQDNFSLNHQAHQATFYLRAGKSGFSYLIAADNQVLAWKDQADWGALEDANVNNILNAPYQKTVVGLLPDALTLMPTNMIADGDASVYARYLDVKEGDKVFVSAFDEDNQLIYKIDASVVTHLGNRFNLQHAVPADRGWINAAIKSFPASDHLYISLNGSQLSVLSFKNWKVCLYNTFEASTIDDVLYYALFVTEQLGLKHTEVTLVVSGNIVYNSPDYQKLAGFFRQIKLNDSRVLPLPYQIPSHQVVALTTLA